MLYKISVEFNGVVITSLFNLNSETKVHGLSILICVPKERLLSGQFICLPFFMQKQMNHFLV